MNALADLSIHWMHVSDGTLSHYADYMTKIIKQPGKCMSTQFQIYFLGNLTAHSSLQ